ncbi:metallophosphoesterase family protein [Frigoriflavimonas asaccharolytica]|uniref:Phosphoesterase n=1 Tax=Frigoriflavimonas asaccharolytica TaxID=2735899 RepID=A0A8J8G572_9FLAO|nr:metallophosphoesterase family protein [Frigoriflavimonas asaccharolytica]NRS91358.1 hypothetical protein [Frigoriflavimonas asaccharolytica]
MTKILLLSDTHSYLDDRILEYAKNADEVWHCGDFGINVAEKLEKIAKVRGVYGNIDDDFIRKHYPETLSFKCEEVSVLMIHIGGYPNRYTSLAKEKIAEHQPKIFITGHSHILKVMNDAKNNLLHMNPGAAGKIGWHQTRTMLKFTIDGEKIENLEVVDFGAK